MQIRSLPVRLDDAPDNTDRIEDSEPLVMDLANALADEHRQTDHAGRSSECATCRQLARAREWAR